MIRYKLKFWRMKQGLTQAQIAEKLTISRGYYKDVENGIYAPSGNLISTFANTFDMKRSEAEDLFGEGHIY